MKRVPLGKTGLIVSRLAYGTLTLGPLQRNFSADKGADLLVYAYERGVDFVDTAQLYQTYPIIREALKVIPRDKFTISTKSYAYDGESAKSTFEEALKEIGTDYIDIFMLHEQESTHTIRGHYAALEYLHGMKRAGHLRAVGLSTHRIEGVRAASTYKDVIDLIHPIINIDGVGIQDGTRDGMVEAIKEFHNLGGGVFAMKAFGGGHLLSKRQMSLDYVLGLDCVDAIAIGMQTFNEIEANIAQIEGRPIGAELESSLNRTVRELVIDPWCTGCGSCVERCRFRALELEDGKAVVNRLKCVTCGYCGSVCPDFCIKII